MFQVSTLRRTQYVGAALLAVLLMGTLIALLQPLLGALIALIGALVVALPALWQAAGERRTTRIATHQASRSLSLEPVAQQSVWTADGTHQHALVVPVERTDEYRLVLTVDGYALINDDGGIVYRLKK